MSDTRSGFIQDKFELLGPVVYLENCVSTDCALKSLRPRHVSFLNTVRSIMKMSPCRKELATGTECHYHTCHTLCSISIVTIPIAEPTTAAIIMNRNSDEILTTIRCHVGLINSSYCSRVRYSPYAYQIQ